MTKNTHTPGPWHVGQGNGEGFIFKTGEGRMRMTGKGTALFPIAQFAMGWDAKEDEANGLLMAAAPDMRDALEEAEKSIAYALDALQAPANCTMRDSLAAVRAALSKARGE